MSAMNLIDAAVEVAAMATDGPMSEITAEEQQTFAATIREKAEEKWPEIEKDAQSVIDIYNKIMPRRDSPLRSQIITSLKAVLDNLKVTVTVTLGKDFQYFNDSIVVEVASPRQRLVSAQKEMGKKGDTHTLAGPAGSLFDLTGLKVDSTLEIAVIDKGTFVDSRRRAVTVKQLVRNAQWGADDDQPYQVDLTID
jgi:hypothetical protein